MGLENLIPGVPQAKLIAVGVGAVAVIAGSIWVYNWWQGYCGPACQLHKTQLEKQLVQNELLTGRLDQALQIGNENAKNLTDLIAREKAADERAAEAERQRNLFWRKLNDIQFVGEDGQLAPGLLPALIELCRAITTSGGKCTAADNQDGKVRLPNVGVQPAVR